MRRTAYWQYLPLCLWNYSGPAPDIQLLLREEKEGISGYICPPCVLNEYVHLAFFPQVFLRHLELCCGPRLLWTLLFLLSLGTRYTYTRLVFPLPAQLLSLYPPRHVPSTSLAYLILSWFCFMEDAVLPVAKQGYYLWVLWGSVYLK